jgi:8-amino-7-oxononanoate synthase
MGEATNVDLFEKCRNYTQANEARARGIYPYFLEVESATDTRSTVSGRRVIMVGSNNYLGLTVHPKVREAAIHAIEKYGSGCTGSRFLNGNLDIHRELEDKLAVFTGQETALVFSTGFQTNLGAISTLVGKGDIVFVDREDHASIMEATRMVWGKVVKFKHNDMADFERVVANNNDSAGKLVVVDGVYSVTGELCPVPELLDIAERAGVKVMVDDAHGIGVLGRCGAGTCDHFGVGDRVDIIMGTFSKSFASLGGFLAGDQVVMDYLRHHARALIFSAAMPPPAVAACLAALEIMQAEPERMQRLTAITARMKAGFERLGFTLKPTGAAIIALHVGDMWQAILFWKELFDNGVYANVFIPPGVAPGQSLIRTSYMATHTDEELDEVLDVFEKAGKKTGLI